MTDLLDLQGGEKVLEIGTGSGYQAAILAEIVDQVYSVEIVKKLAQDSKSLLRKLGYNTIRIKHGDGYQGWSEHSPFDGIIVTAVPDHIPKPLEKQLKKGAKMVIPVRFVPMTGEAKTKKVY